MSNMNCGNCKHFSPKYSLPLSEGMCDWIINAEQIPYWLIIVSPYMAVQHNFTGCKAFAAKE